MEDLCRLCGSYSDVSSTIFDENNRYQAIIKENLPNLKMFKDCILPDRICFKCIEKLTAWNEFCKTCNHVANRYEIMKKIILEDEKIDNFQEDIRKIDEISAEGILCSFEMYDNFFECRKIKEETVDDEENPDRIEVVEVNLEEPYPSCSAPVSTLYDQPIANDIKQELISDSESINEYENMSELDYRVKMEALSFDEENDSSTSCSNSPRYFNDDYLHSIPRNTTDENFSQNQASLNSAQLMCHMCGKIFLYRESLRRHLKTVHSDEKPFKCNLCSANFNRNHNLTVHIQSVHEKNHIYQKKNTERLCDYCGKVLLSVRSLQEHISSIHTKKALYQCDKCHKNFFRKITYDKHKSNDDCDKFREVVEVRKEGYLKICDICGLEFKKEHFFVKHMLNKHTMSFNCPECNEKYNDRQSLSDHTDKMHPQLCPFKCTFPGCNKNFKTKSLLKSHIYVHGSDKRWECNKCPLKFRKKKYLATHILIHTDEKPFKCSFCDKKFRQSGDMRKHKAGHLRKKMHLDSEFDNNILNEDLSVELILT